MTPKTPDELVDLLNETVSEWYCTPVSPQWWLYVPMGMVTNGTIPLTAYVPQGLLQTVLEMTSLEALLSSFHQNHHSTLDIQDVSFTGPFLLNTEMDTYILLSYWFHVYHNEKLTSFSFTKKES